MVILTGVPILGQLIQLLLDVLRSHLIWLLPGNKGYYLGILDFVVLISIVVWVSVEVDKSRFSLAYSPMDITLWQRHKEMVANCIRAAMPLIAALYSLEWIFSTGRQFSLFAPLFKLVSSWPWLAILSVYLKPFILWTVACYSAWLLCSAVARFSFVAPWVEGQMPRLISLASKVTGRTPVPFVCTAVWFMSLGFRTWPSSVYLTILAVLSSILSPVLLLLIICYFYYLYQQLDDIKAFMNQAVLNVRFTVTTNWDIIIANLITPPLLLDFLQNFTSLHWSLSTALLWVLGCICVTISDQINHPWLGNHLDAGDVNIIEAEEDMVGLQGIAEGQIQDEKDQPEEEHDPSFQQPQEEERPDYACVICLQTDQKMLVTIPCGHPVCEGCADRYEEFNRQRRIKCMFCNEPIRRYNPLFLV